MAAPSPAQFPDDDAFSRARAHRAPAAPTWTHVDKLQAKLGIENRDAIDAAIRVAVARGWMRADGDPPASITLTVDGVKLIEPQK